MKTTKLVIEWMKKNKKIDEDKIELKTIYIYCTLHKKDPTNITLLLVEFEQDMPNINTVQGATKNVSKIG